MFFYIWRVDYENIAHCPTSRWWNFSSGGLIQKCIKHGDDFLVLFATNGDYHGFDIAEKRYYESEQALASLGLAKESIFYLGYGDTGMKPSHSFLKRMQFKKMILYWHP